MSRAKTGDGSDASEHEPGPRVDPPALDALGKRLKQSYQEVVDEGIPPKFFELLDQLRRKDQSPDTDEA